MHRTWSGIGQYEHAIATEADAYLVRHRLDVKIRCTAIDSLLDNFRYEFDDRSFTSEIAQSIYVVAIVGLVEIIEKRAIALGIPVDKLANFFGDHASGEDQQFGWTVK